ncbi:564_t:CDS:2, partial [Racocetra persica]
DIEDQNPLPLLVSSQLKEFQESYAKINQNKKWALSSKKCIKDIIFKYYRQLSTETYIHSWIIDLDDREAEKLFSMKEWNKIRHSVRELLQVDRTFAESMIRFSNMCVEVQTKSKLRQILNTMSFLNEGKPYNRETHYDADLTDFKDPNELLQKQHLESWFDINVWSLIIDHSLQNVIGIETVRKVECKKIGYRIDGILQMYIDNVEYGVIEVAKKFEATKLLSDGYKLGKAMHDILICLSQKVHFEEARGYVSILKREKLLEVPAKVDKIKDLIRVLANVWILK